MPQLRHILCSLAVLVMVSAQNTPTINADSTSTAQTAYTLSDTSIAAATGSPPPVASTTIHLAPPASNSVATLAQPPSSSSSVTPAATSTASPSSPILSVPAIAGIAASGAFVLIAAILFITFLCIRSRRKGADKWPELPEETLYRSAASQPSLRRPSSAATLVVAPAHAYVHSKGSMEHQYSAGAALLHHSKSNKSFKSSRSTILERVSEETAKDFKFDFGVPPKVEVTPPPLASAEVQVHEDTLRRLCSDKSLPSSPEGEIPPSGLDLDDYRAGPLLEVNGNRPRSNIYSTATGTEANYGRENWTGTSEKQSQSFF